MDSNGQVQFKMTVEAPRSRVEQELVPVLLREPGWTVTLEHVQEGGFAAIGTDGTRPVVWGVGVTEEEALAEARDQIIENCEPHERDIDLVVAAVTAERMARIVAGEVGAEGLGLA